MVVPQSFADEGHSEHHSNHEHHPDAMEEMGAEMEHDMEAHDMDSHSMESHDIESHSGHHSHDTPMEVGEGIPAPSVELTLVEDAVGGWNLEIQTTNFDFAPENVNQPHQDGEGHGHLYFNGEKVSRVYANWVHIPSLPSGSTEIRVSLHANTHEPLAVNGDIVADSVTVEVP